MPPKREATEDLASLRLKSRYSYLEKREQLKLAELQRDVEEDNEEIAKYGSNLSKRELHEMERRRQTLQLALQRAKIDDSVNTGFFIPDEANLNESKLEVLNKKNKSDVYKSEVQLWEEEQTAKARAAQTQRPGREREDDYEFVFDEQQQIKWTSDGKDLNFMDPDKQQLQAQLDEAERKAKTIQETRASLPVAQHRDTIINAVKEHRILVLMGETGSGKSTQTPQYLRDSGYCKTGKIVVSQPRRVACLNLAARVSEEVASSSNSEAGKKYKPGAHRLGGIVGYNIRFDNKSGPDTEIIFETEGMLLREILADPLLSEYSCVILDEAHERTTDGDTLMALLKDLSRARPDDFRLVISSATLNAQKFSAYFDDAPILAVAGRTFEVERFYLPSPEANYLSATVTTIFTIHLAAPLDGDILCFLTGSDEILAAMENIQETSRKLGSRMKELIVRPLYSQLDPDEQALVFVPTPKGARKVILATNIAETSLTVDGVSYVIDCGYTKENQYNATTDMSQLVVVPCSRASVNQRAGRAGRQRKGSAFHLFTKFSYFNEMEEETVPEIMRVDLTPLCLLLKSLQINDVLNFGFMDPPPPATLAKALENLYALGALNDTGALTSVGRKLIEMPIDAKLARAILAADEFKVVDEVLVIAAMLSESATLFLRPKDKKVHADAARNRFVQESGGDHMLLLSVFNAWRDAEYDPIFAKENFLQQRTLNRCRDVYEQLGALCDRIEVQRSSNPGDHVGIKKALVAGYFQNAARMARDGQSYRTIKTGQTVAIHPSSCLHEPTRRPKLMLFHELVLTSREFARNCMPIESEWLMSAAPHYYKKEDIEKMSTDKKMPKGKGKVGVDGR
ncbi:putative MRNA splicing factor RNA helicase [Bimuria novae-zelandiae CBS 107.79]|uniref:RNA helicase n=1 Tax=Bimuria novae-zelandiae CBS 107.79 TaxID=1447943 RepID=A0A6A5VQD3_9PLEO|nr:putative MRNA splicing factor RNA helicase [Bimuria novae-zelandiae CBS 107.79]